MKDTREWLQKEFEHFEASPPVDLWPEIEARMKEEKAQKRKWIPYFSIAASVLILFGFFWSLEFFERDNSTELAKLEKQETPFQGVEESENPLTVEKTEPIIVDLSTDEKNNSIDSSNEESISKEKVERIIQDTPQSPNQLFAEAGIQEEIPNEGSTETTIENAEEPVLTLSNIEPLSAPVVIGTTDTYKNRIVDEVTPIATESSVNIKRVGSTNKLDLNDLTLENAVVFASNGLNRIVNTPIEIHHEDAKEGVVKTYSFRLGNFSITRKQHVKTIKTDRS